MEVRTAIDAKQNPIVLNGILTDRGEVAKLRDKKVVYPDFNLTGRFMNLVFRDKWGEADTFKTYDGYERGVPVHVIGENDNSLFIEIQPHAIMFNRYSSSFVTSINKHDIYRGRVALVD